MEKFEILGELPNCDLQTQNEKTLLEQEHQQMSFMQGRLKPSLYKEQCIWEVQQSQAQ